MNRDGRCSQREDAQAQGMALRLFCFHEGWFPREISQFFTDLIDNPARIG